MTIQKLTLKNFRNFENLELEFTPGQTLIVGPNGSGKSNILEAIYLLASGLSRRADREEEMINWGSDYAKIKAQTGEEFDLDLTLSFSAEVRLAKTAQVNGVKKPLRQFIQNVYAVEFSPQDLDLVSGSPEGRRRYLNGVLSQVSREYHQNFSAYEKARHEKNALLEKIRDGEAKERDLDVWNEQILSFGQPVQSQRRSFLNFLSENERNLSFEHHPSLISAERLSQFRPREVAAGVSLIGPHRDDFRFAIRNSRLAETDLAHFGSRGEQRMAVFTLKNRELEYFRERLKVEPVLLLDDIFSELDHDHRQEVLVQIGFDHEGQVVLTATDSNFLEKSEVGEMKVIKL